MIEQLLLLVIEVRPTDEFQRILHPKGHLRSLLVPIRLAQDLVRIGKQLRVPRPFTIPDVALHRLPLPTVVKRIVRLNAAIVAEPATVVCTTPDEVV